MKELLVAILTKRNMIAASVSIALIAFATHYTTLPEQSLEYQISPEKRAFLARKKAKKDAHPKRYDKPQEAIDFFIKQRLPLGQQIIPSEKYGQAKLHIDEMQQYSFSSNDLKPSRNLLKLSSIEVEEITEPGVVKEWSNIGPGNIGGRTRTLLIDPQTPETMYTAGVAGGVWKTIDAGQSWWPLDDMMVNLAVTTLVFAPGDSNTLYAGTGEGFFNGDALRGDGIFKSNDGGATWDQLLSTSNNDAFRYVNKLEASSSVEGRLYAATRAGLYRSDDAGVSWTELMAAPDSVGCLDVKLRNDLENDVLLLSCGSFYGATVFHSDNGGESFSAVIEDELLGRTTLAFAPSNQNIVYALGAANESDASVYKHGFYKLYRSEDGGVTWSIRNSSENSNVLNTLLLSNPVFAMFPECGWGDDRSFYNQGWYDNIIKVDPVNPDIVWAGGIDLWRSDDAGANWDVVSRWWADVSASNYAHADQHTIKFHPNYDGITNKTLYVGNDGGIQRTDNTDGATLGIHGICGGEVDNSVSWTTLNNNYAVTQFYHGAVFPGGTTYFGGTQDNGTNKGDDDSGPQNWFEVSGGDGGWVAVDARDTDVIFSEYTGLSLQRWDSSAGWVDATNGIEDAYLFPFITPFMMDANNPDVLWIGNDRLWRTNDQGDNWAQASAPTLDESIVSELAVAPGNSDRVIAGTDSGVLMISTSASHTNATSQWHSVQPAQGYVSDIAISPSNNTKAYATYSTFGVAHIWRTDDGGLSWEAIDNMGLDNGLPDIPVNTIVIDPSNTSRIFVGTDMGIFVSVDAGENWSIDGSGLANTIVTHLEINNGQLYAFTHGRSAYRVALSSLPAALPADVSVDEDQVISFSEEMFSSFNGGAPDIETIVLHELPTNGRLMLGELEITELSPIAFNEVANLSFIPAANFNGELQIGWHAESNNEPSSTNSDLNITVNPVNDEPDFSINQVTNLVEPTQTGVITVATIVPSAVPQDESEQQVVYSVSPMLLDFANVEIDSASGELCVVLIAEREGKVTFTIEANDGQTINGSYSKTVDFEVKKPSSGGGGNISWISLLAFSLIVLRRTRGYKN